jgi:hypothetical protein
MVWQKRLSLPFVPPFPEKDDPWKSFRPELYRHAQGKVRGAKDVGQPQRASAI